MRGTSDLLDQPVDEANSKGSIGKNIDVHQVKIVMPVVEQIRRLMIDVEQPVG